jgi:hypothetical protein
MKCRQENEIEDTKMCGGRMEEGGRKNERIK